MQTLKKIKLFIFGLSPVKRKIAMYLSEGYSTEETAKKVSKENNASIGNTKAYVTMVVNAGKKKGIEFETKQTKNSNDYVGEGKQTIRAYVYKHISEVAKRFNIKGGTILTLSCYECNMELHINNMFKRFKFLSYECNTERFKRLLINIKNRNYDFMLKPINNYIIHAIQTAKKNTYSHLLLDFCKIIKVHGKDIELALKKDIVKKHGLVWITVSARAGKGINSYDALIELINKAGNGRYKLMDIPKDVVCYRDTSPMVSIVIQRIK